MSDINFTGSININDLKKKVEADKAKTEKSKYKNIYWKPSQPETIVRIVPYKHGKSPFNELHFHYDVNGETILCPKYTFGKADCPLCDHVSKLYGSSLEENKIEAKRLRAKVRYYIPIINKTEVSKGVEPKIYFWGVAPTVYETLIKYCLEEEDYGDIANPKEGNDIIVKYTEKSAQNIFGKIDLIVRPKKTPMLPDQEVVNKLYNEVPNIFDLFKELTTEELRAKLSDLLKSGDNSSENSVDEEIGSEKSDLENQISELIKEQ